MNRSENTDKTVTKKGALPEDYVFMLSNQHLLANQLHYLPEHPAACRYPLYGHHYPPFDSVTAPKPEMCVKKECHELHTEGTAKNDPRNESDYHTASSSDEIKGCNLSQHVEAIYSSKNPKCHQCSHCSYSTAYRGDLVKHTRAKHSQNHKSHMCSQCEFSSAYRESLAVHVKVQHSLHDVKCHRCSYCTYRTAYRSDLVKHTNARHSTDKSKMHKCLECNFFSPYRESLLKHLKVKHSATSVKFHECPHCNYKTAYKSDLAKHMNARHPITEAYNSNQI